VLQFLLKVILTLPNFSNHCFCSLFSIEKESVKLFLVAALKLKSVGFFAMVNIIF